MAIVVHPQPPCLRHVNPSMGRDVLSVSGLAIHSSMTQGLRARPSLARELASTQSEIPMKNHLLLTAAAVVFTPFLAIADEAGDSGSWAIDNVVVTGKRDAYAVPDAATATRTATPIEKIPQSIQILTRTLIEEQELQTPADALRNVSGVVPVPTNEIVLQSPIVRGFEAQYFIDGLPAYGLPDSVVDPGTLINVERLEIAKGPTSTLYGGGAGAPLGGLINFVSRAPNDETGAEIFVRAGSYETLGAGGAFDLAFDGGGFRLAGAAEQADSFIDVVDSERWSLFPTLVLKLDEATQMTLRGQWTRIEQLEYSGLPFTLIGAPGVDPFTFAGSQDAPPTTIENRLVTAEISHQLTDALTLDMAIRHYDSEFREYGTFPLPFVPIAGTTYNFGSAVLPTDVEQTFATVSVLWRTATGGIDHQILMGLDYDETDYRAGLGFLADFTFTGLLGPIDYADPSTNQPWIEPAVSDIQTDSMSTVAVFLQDQIALGERLDVTLGLRWSQLEIDSAYSSFGFSLADTSETYYRLTPRVGATLELVDGISLFAGYSEGFQGVLVFSGAEPPKPETSQSYEAGIKFAAPIEGLTGTLAIYEITRQNVRTPDPGNPFLSVQAGEQQANGFEIDLIYEPLPALSILGTYAYTDAEVTQDNSIPVGDRLTRVPEHSRRLAVRYRFQDEVMAGLELGAGLTYAGERELTLPNSASVDGFVLFDAQASYDLGPATLSLSIVNLTDALEYEPYQYLGRAVVMPTQPRSAFVTLKSSF
ncbi:MAG: TonB-dependent receptor [Alphaproteobacteria bacterium]|nr:TonB-dependent receptor [Alphaproteobacteria bacterium]